MPYPSSSSASAGCAPSASADLGSPVRRPSLLTMGAVGLLPNRAASAWLGRLDMLGIILSAACIVHCAAMPLLLVMVPLLGDHAFEEGARTLLGSVGVLGIGLGAWQHRNLRAVPPLLMALVIFSWMAWVQPRGPVELLLSIVASFALMLAHALNTWACSAAQTSSTHNHALGDGVWVPERRQPRMFALAVAFSVGLHVGSLGLAMQADGGASPRTLHADSH